MIPTEVVITNVKMPFWSMVRFMVKWSIASIPAVIILAIIAGVIFIGLIAGMEILVGS